MMLSLKARLLIFAMRHRHLLQGRLKPESWDRNTSVPAFRAQCERMTGRLARLPGDIRVLPLSVAGRPSEWLIPVDSTQAEGDEPVSTPASDQPVILYAIGGGYISGSCNDHRSMVAKIAAGSRVPILMVEHRLAPEDPYPAALEDLVGAYAWLLKEGYDPSRIMIVGESAGGGLCLATLLALRDQDYPLPVAAVALSPWTDLALTGESHRTKARVCMSPPGMSKVCSAYYVGKNDPTLPWISPLYGDLHGLPPVLIMVGGDETLLDDSTRFARKAADAGVDVTLRVGEGMMHCYPLMAPLFSEATEGLREVCSFVRTHLGLESVALPAEMLL